MVDRVPTPPLTHIGRVPIVEASDVEVNKATFKFPIKGEPPSEDRATRKFKVRGETWSVDKQLMGGSFGMAYLATHQAGGRFVIKVFEHSNDAELDILRSIPYETFEHPNLCQYVGIFRDIGGKFSRARNQHGISFDPKAMVCMQAIPNGELLDLLNGSASSTKFSEATLRRFVRDIIKGMSCLAKHKITHGDLKHDNLLIDQRGTVVIIDLGCAKKHAIDADASRDPFFVFSIPDSPLLARLKRMEKEELEKKARAMCVEKDALDRANGKQDPNMAIMNLILDKVNMSVLEQLRAMTLDALMMKARDEGVEEDAVTSADGATDPKEEIIRLILAQLRGMRLQALKMKARVKGFGADTLERVDFETDPKETVIELILSSKAIETLEEDLKLLGELRRTEPGDLKKRAHEEGFSETAIANACAQQDQKGALIQLISHTPLLAQLHKMTLKGLKKKAVKEGLVTDEVDEALDPKEKAIQLILHKKVSSGAPVFKLLCKPDVARFGAQGYAPPERGTNKFGAFYDCERGDVFSVGLITLMMRWITKTETITANGSGIVPGGLTQPQWDKAKRQGASFSEEFKDLLNAMLSEDPDKRPTWEELESACNKTSPLKRLGWLSLPVSEPLYFFQELTLQTESESESESEKNNLQNQNQSIAKHLTGSQAVEALLKYVGTVSKDNIEKAFKAAITAQNGKLSVKELHEAKLSVKELHEAMLQQARDCGTSIVVSEMDLASLMCRFAEPVFEELEPKRLVQVQTMLYWEFETMLQSLSSGDHEVTPIIGRSKSRHYAWTECGGSEEEECQRFAYTIRDRFKNELWPEESDKKRLEDSLCHICFSIEKETCQLHCNVFRMDNKMILESKRQWGSVVEEEEILKIIKDAVSRGWGQAVKPPVVLAAEWLLPAMQEGISYEVGEAQQIDKKFHVVLKDAPNGSNKTKVPNGEIMIILAEEDKSYKVKWTTIEGWAKKCNVVNLEKVRGIKPKPSEEVAQACATTKPTLDKDLDTALLRQKRQQTFSKRQADVKDDYGEIIATVRLHQELQISMEKSDRSGFVRVLWPAKGWANADDVSYQPPWEKGNSLGTLLPTMVDTNSSLA